MPKTRDSRHLRAMGDRIRVRREWLCKSQRELALLCGVSTAQFGKYEAGQDDMPTQTVVKLAEALQTTASILLGDPARHDASGAALAVFTADPVVATILAKLRDLDPPRRVLAQKMVRSL